nr:hypothetical protein [Cytophagales bacterium]
MKTYVLILSALCLFVSCQEDVDLNRPDLELSKAPESLEQMYSDGLENAMRSLSQNLKSEGNGRMFLDRRSLQATTFKHLEGKYFKLGDFDTELFFAGGPDIAYLDDSIFDPGSPEFQKTMEAAFSSEQLQVLNTFLDRLFETEDYVKVKDLAREFQNGLAGSYLSEEDRLELYSMGAGIYALADFLEKGGMDMVGEELGLGNKNAGTNPNLRCRVDMRAVWAGAVLTGGIGAVRGAMIGCAGGSIFLLGFGTVTGCVGGAVFGGAGGFVEGAIGGIAGSLLLTCWRR